MPRERPICRKCKRREVEHDDEQEWESACCPECNDVRIAHANERAEFHYFHPK